MDIVDIRTLKKEAEERIVQALDDFAACTGVSVHRVGVSVIDLSTTQLFSVNIVVEV